MGAPHVNGAEFLQFGNIPTCLEVDIHRLQQQELQQHNVVEHESQRNTCWQLTDDWMLICQHHPNLGDLQGDVDQIGVQLQLPRPNLENEPSFATQNGGMATFYGLKYYIKARNFVCQAL